MCVPSARVTSRRSKVALLLLLAGGQVPSIVEPGIASAATPELLQERAYVPRLPAAMSLDDFAGMAALLVLSNEQRMHCQTIFENHYLPEYERVRQEHWEPLIASASKPGGAVDLYTIQHATTYLAEKERLRAALEVIDSSFFSSVDAVLSEQQRLNLPRAKNRRARACADPDYKDLTEAQIDLVRVMAQLPTCDNEDAAAVDLIIAEYEAKVTPLFLGVDALFRARGGDLLWYLFWRTHGNDNQPLEKGSALQKERSRLFGSRRQAILAQSLEFQQSIVEIHRRYLQLILESVSPACAASLAERCRHLAHPQVFPDLDDTADLYAAFQSVEFIAPEVRKSLHSAWNAYRRDVDTANTQMCMMFDQCMEDMARYQGIVRHAEMRQLLREQRDRRWNLHENMLFQLRALLPPEASALRTSIADALARITVQRLNSERDTFPGW